MPDTLDEKLADALAVVLAPHGLRSMREDDEDFMSADDEIAFVGADEAHSLVRVQLSNAGSPGSYAIVNEDIYETLDLGIGIPFERYVGVRRLGEFRRSDVDGIAACVRAGLERTAFALSKGRSVAPTAFDHPIMRPIALAVLELGLPFRPVLDPKDQGLVVETEAGDVGIFAKDGTAEVRQGDDVERLNAAPGRGDDWSRAVAAVKLAVEAKLAPVPRPA